jgi:hypothetical protein
MRRNVVVLACDLRDSHAKILPPGATHATAAVNNASLSSPEVPRVRPHHDVVPVPLRHAF